MKNKGFTLIELLLVISIISLLSSIIISQVQDSRKKANLAAIKQEVTSLKNEAEIYYTSNGNRYTNFPVSFFDEPCPDAQQTLQWGFLVTDKGQELLNSLKKRAGNQSAKCSINPDSYAISIDILGNTISNNTLGAETVYAAATDYLCFDSSGGFVVLAYDSASDGVERESVIVFNKNTNKYTCK